MYTLTRYCKLCLKSTNQSIETIKVRPYLKKEMSTCSQCETTLIRFVDCMEHDEKLKFICDKCKAGTQHSRTGFGTILWCTVCGQTKK